MDIEKPTLVSSKWLLQQLAAVSQHMGDSSIVTKVVIVALVVPVILLLAPAYLHSRNPTAAVDKHTHQSTITIQQDSPAAQRRNLVQQRIAIAVQGKLKHFQPWNMAIQAVHQADLFYLAYDNNASCTGEPLRNPQSQDNKEYTATCVHAPSTWTTGRNR